jgi:hypothetical protein
MGTAAISFGNFPPQKHSLRSGDSRAASAGESPDTNMKFAVLIVLPVLCMPVTGALLRSPAQHLMSIDIESGDPGSFDETGRRSIPDAYLNTTRGFAPFIPEFNPDYTPEFDADAVLAGACIPSACLTLSLNSASSFGPEPDILSVAPLLSTPFPGFLRFSLLLRDAEPSDLMILLVGLTGVTMSLFVRIPRLLRMAVAELPDNVRRSGRLRVRNQHRKLL